MRRRILVPIRDDPEPTEDEARLGLLNWLSQPRVISSPEDTQLLSIFAARNIAPNGRASMVHPYKTCYANVDEAKSELKLRADVEIVAKGKIPNDGIVIEDTRTYE